MRFLTIVFLTCFLLLGSALPGTASAAHALFDRFVWGAQKNELALLPGATRGEDSFAGDLMLPEATFAGLPWNVRLVFENDRLIRVSLMERYSRERMEAVTRQLKTDKFEMLSVLIDASYLDLVKVMKQKGPEAVKGEWARFVKDKKPERMVYAWFDTSKHSKDMKTMARDLGQLLAIGPSEAREAEVVLLRDPKTSLPGMLLVDFSLPAMR